MRIQPTGFASLRSARLRLMRVPLACTEWLCYKQSVRKENHNVQYFSAEYFHCLDSESVTAFSFSSVWGKQFTCWEVATFA